MTALTLTPKTGVTLLAVEVPEGAYEFQLIDVHELMFWHNDSNGYVVRDLPPSKYSIVGKLSEITEEQAKPLVEYYRWSGDSSNFARILLRTAVEKAGGIWGKNYLILKQEV